MPIREDKIHVRDFSGNPADINEYIRSIEYIDSGRDYSEILNLDLAFDTATSVGKDEIVLMGLMGNYSQVEENLKYIERYSKKELCHVAGSMIVSKNLMLVFFEETYRKYFGANPDKLLWIASNFSEVYDNSRSNILSGTDYRLQETTKHHFQDIAVRRIITDAGLTFTEGKPLLRARSIDRIGGFLSPGNMSFGPVELIANVSTTAWWRRDSLEDFYQKSKGVIVLRKEFEAHPLMEDSADRLAIICKDEFEHGVKAAEAPADKIIGNDDRVVYVDKKNPKAYFFVNLSIYKSVKTRIKKRKKGRI